MRTHTAGGTLAALAALVIVVSTACGSSTTPERAGTNRPTPSTSSTTTAPMNSVDAAFVATLARLGSQDLTMADLVAGRAGRPELATLVPVIRRHATDIDAMHAWLARWARAGVTAGATTAGVSAAALQEMSALRGTSFDDSWLDHLAANHAAAVAACRYELAHGVNPHAQRLARDWSAWMHDQFDRMRHWHTAWMHDDHFPHHPHGFGR